MKRATKLLLLEFIKEQDFVKAIDLMQKFGYTRGGADSTLHWLKGQRLIINETRGVWTITDTGTRRLLYYGRY